MKYCLFLIVALSISKINAQERLVYGAKCTCSDFVERYDTTNDVISIGEHKVFPTLVSPADKVNEFIKNRISDSKTTESVLLYSILVDETGEIDCIYLMHGELNDTSNKIAEIIHSEFSFEPAKLRERQIEAPYYLKVSI